MTLQERPRLHSLRASGCTHAPRRRQTRHRQVTACNNRERALAISAGQESVERVQKPTSTSPAADHLPSAVMSCSAAVMLAPTTGTERERALERRAQQRPLAFSACSGRQHEWRCTAHYCAGQAASQGDAWLQQALHRFQAGRDPSAGSRLLQAVCTSGWLPVLTAQWRQWRQWQLSLPLGILAATSSAGAAAAAAAIATDCPPGSRCHCGAGCRRGCAGCVRAPHLSCARGSGWRWAAGGVGRQPARTLQPRRPHSQAAGALELPRSLCQPPRIMAHAAKALSNALERLIAPGKSRQP